MSTDAIRNFAVISDIHGNLESLEAVLADIDRQKFDKLYCCGDIVGYGASPNECIDLVLKERKIPTIAGNHDHAAIKLIDITFFNEIAKRAIVWTQNQLTEQNRKLLSELRMSISEDSLFFVHSSPKDPEKWNYIITMGEARLNFRCFQERFCFVGHSHHPFIIVNSKDVLSTPERFEVTIDLEKRYLINVGSVGQPRDRNSKAAYAVCDLERKTLAIRRVEYDIELAQKRIIDAGIPKELADRLAIGW